MCGGSSSVHTAAVLGFSLLDSTKQRISDLARASLCIKFMEF